MKRRDFIKSVGAAGTISLLGAGRTHGNSPWFNGAGPKTALKAPFDLALSASGDLFVSDSPSYRVLRLDSSHKPVLTFGKAGAHVGRLNFPRGIAVDPDGLVYVVDSNNCRVQVFDESGMVKRAIGSIGSIGGTFSTPQGVCIDGKGRLYVADTRNHRIQIFENDELTAVLGELGDDKEQFRLPTATAARTDGEILVLDSKHGLVKVFGPDLKFRFSFGGVGSAPGMFNMPQGMKLDEEGGVWVADSGNHRIQRFSPDGKFLCVFGKAGFGPGEFKNPTGIALGQGRLYVADNGNGRIQVMVNEKFEILGLDNNIGSF